MKEKKKKVKVKFWKIGKKKYTKEELLRIIKLLEKMGFMVIPKKKGEIICKIKVLENPVVKEKPTWASPGVIFNYELSFPEDLYGEEYPYFWNCNGYLDLYQIINFYKDRILK